MKINRLLAGIAALVLTLGTMHAVTPITVTEENPTVSQNFDNVTGQTLPDGWAINKHIGSFRVTDAWSAGSGSVEFISGPNLASNATNGTYLFKSSENSNDYAVGGITTNATDKTNTVSLMTALTNGSDRPINSIDLSYAIEKYRYGSNPAGWLVALRYSLDGETWTDAFRHEFDPDATTAGAAVVPITTTPVNNEILMVDVAPGQTVYLAWMSAVKSGSTSSNSQVFGIDDIVLKANFINADAHFVYIENATKLNGLSIYAPSNADYYGAAPGQTSSLTKIVNGVTYYVWDVKGTDAYEITVTAGSTTVGTYTIAPDKDTYLCASPDGLEYIADPATYTGWTDPNRPPFVASGIYLRGEVNSWNDIDNWEFSKEGENTYVLYDVVLSGMFKVADSSWSSNCNYGSNGSNIMVDEPYTLVSGTDTNISCGNNVFTCSRIVLTIENGTATLLLEADDSENGLTSVYMIGDFNNWNYMSTAGELKLDEDGLFKGRASLTAGQSGKSNWLVYLRQGKCGAYGAGDTDGVLVKGSTTPVATAPATYDVTFDLSTGAYTLTEVESSPAVLTLSPANTVLVPELPETVKVLSLNNSLIHYNDQAKMFNDIAASMGKDATWTKHTNLGKTLKYHWEEGDGLADDGTPGAKMMVRSDAWSHIILQEQTAYPRTNLEDYRNSVKTWVDYIREYCPNPNAVIILPMNWHFAQDWSNFTENNSLLMKNITDVATELGVIVCPVNVAYQAKFDKDGGDVTEKEWFLPGDDRHPTIRSTYMAACMEYGLIFNEDPATIAYYPEYTTDYDELPINASIAEDMRNYASNALKAYNNTVKHHEGTIDFKSAVYDDFGIEVPAQKITFTVDGGGSITEDGKFTSDGTRGTFTVTATSGDFTKTATVTVADAETEVPVYPSVSISLENPVVEQNFDTIGQDDTATLPEGWRIDKQTVAPRTIGTFAVAQEQTMYAGGASLPSNAKNGIWNFGATGSDDRAVGGISTGVDNGTRCINVYTHLYNEGKKPIGALNIAYDIEKYRKGVNAAGFAVQMYYSYDGSNWTSAGDDFRTFFAADNATAGYDVVPGEVKAVEASLPVNFGGNMDLYLAWNISVASGSDAQGAMALAIDNVTIEGVKPPVPEYKYHIYVEDNTSYDALGLYAWGDSELFGAWPGQAVIDEQEISGKTYKVFGHDADTGSFSFIFNNMNNGKQLPDVAVTGGRDYYFTLDDNAAKIIEDPSGVENVATDDAAVITYVNGTVVSNVPTSFNVFSTAGNRVAYAFGTLIDLSHLTPGVYMVRAGASTMKIRI